MEGARESQCLFHTTKVASSALRKWRKKHFLKPPNLLSPSMHDRVDLVKKTLS